MQAADVILDSARNKPHLLRNVAESVGDVAEGKPLDVDAAEEDPAARAWEASKQGFCEDGLARSALADDLHRRARLDLQIDGTQELLLGQRRAHLQPRQ